MTDGDAIDGVVDSACRLLRARRPAALSLDDGGGGGEGPRGNLRIPKGELPE